MVVSKSQYFHKSVIIDIPFFNSHSQSNFLLKEKGLDMIPKYGRTEAQSWPYGSEKNTNV